MKKLAGKLGIDELVTTAKPLNLDTVHLAEGAAGVTTLGQSIIDEKVCQALMHAGVKGYSTRTVGYNHVNLKAAAEAGIRNPCKQCNVFPSWSSRIYGNVNPHDFA